jgi:hypothetical protein
MVARLQSGVCAAVKKYFATPLRSPLAGLFRYTVEQVYIFWKSYTDKGQTSFTFS